MNRQTLLRTSLALLLVVAAADVSAQFWRAAEAKAHSDRGEALYLESKFAEAEAAFRRAIAVDPGEVAWHTNLIASLSKQNKLEPMEVAYREALRPLPHNAAMLHGLGYLYVVSGKNLDEAVLLLLRAVREEPDNGDYLDTLAVAYSKLGDLEAGERHLRNAVALAPQDAVIAEHLRQVSAARGNKPAAPPVAAPSGSVLEWLRVSVQNADTGALPAIASKGEAAVPGLIEALQDKDLIVRAWAARILARLGPRASAAAPALLVGLVEVHKTAATRYNVEGFYQALISIGPSGVPALLGTLAARDHSAAARLSDAHRDASYADSAAITVVQSIGRPALPALLAALASRDEGLWLRAARGIAKIGPPPEAVPGLLTVLEKAARENPARWYAVEALGKIGPAAVPQLLGALNQAHARSLTLPVALYDQALEDARRTMKHLEDVIEAIGTIGLPAAGAVPVLTEILKDPWKDVDSKVSVSAPREAARALGRLGPTARTAIPLLTRAYNQEKKAELYVGIANSSTAAVALVRLGAVPDGVVAFLIKVLEAERSSTNLNTEVLEALGMLGAKAKPALGVLAGFLKTADDADRETILQVIKRIESGR